jgi:hypothetical protein
MLARGCLFWTKILTVKNVVFWDVALCRSYVSRRFWGTYHLHFQGRKIRERGTSMSSCCRVCNLLHRCCTSGTVSQHRFLPGASSIFFRPYPGSSWHSSDLLMVHHLVQSAHLSLCSKGELSGLFSIVHRWISIGTVICHSLQWGISIGPISSCIWGCFLCFCSSAAHI